MSGLFQNAIIANPNNGLALRIYIYIYIYAHVTMYGIYISYIRHIYIYISIYVWSFPKCDNCQSKQWTCIAKIKLKDCV